MKGKRVNSYLAVLCITIVGSVATLMIVRVSFDESSYLAFFGYGQTYQELISP